MPQSLSRIFWQGDYGDFPIGWSQLDDLVTYIDHPDHHRTQTFREEYRHRLANCHVEFDERYVWDGGHVSGFD